jgi:ubiquinone/menaquinone biosynthesis C-methylase UbiE
VIDEAAASFSAVTPYYDELMAGVPYRYWVKYVEDIWRRYDLAPRSVLDVACGTGTTSRLLKAREYEIAGVDLSAGMIAVARQRANEEGLAIEYRCQNAAEMDFGERRFDAAISLFDSLNYILEPERLRAAFARVFAHLAPGGSFLFDLNTEYAYLQNMFDQTCSRKSAPLHYRWRSRYDSARRICTVNMYFSYDHGSGRRERFKEVHRQRCHSVEEVRAWLTEAGFASVDVYDAYSFNPPWPSSDRLFYMALR